MVIQSKVEFSQIPSLELILEKIKKRTGLNIVYDISSTPDEDLNVNNKRIYVRCENMGKIELYLDYDTNRVEVLTYSPVNHYLFCATIFSLIKMGGKTNMRLPKWASRKWKDIRWWHMAFK